MRSHLQEAADRVRTQQEACEKTDSWLKVCQDEYTKAKMAFAEAERNLNDTKSLLHAQQCKLIREVNSVRDIVGVSYSYNGDNGMPEVMLAY
jgi:hypothetical protein